MTPAVHAGADAAETPDADLARWVDGTGATAPRLISGGLALAGVAFLAALVFPGLGALGTIALGSAFTIGGGLTFLGVRKLQRERMPPAAPALTPQRRALMHERSRRVVPVLSQGAVTFDHLMTQLRWTEQALVETLAFMKEANLVVEDLDLDTGEWVYRLHAAEVGGRAGPTLAERQARLGLGSGLGSETSA